MKSLELFIIILCSFVGLQADKLSLLKQEFSRDTAHLSLEQQKEYWVSLHNALHNYEAKNSSKYTDRVKQVSRYAGYAFLWYIVAEKMINVGDLPWKSFTVRLAYMGAWFNVLSNLSSVISEATKIDEEEFDLQQMIEVSRSRAGL